MARINNQGYIEKKVTGSNTGGKYRRAIYREWFFVTVASNGRGNIVGRSFNLTFNMPKRYIGKKVRFKVEIVDEDK